MLSIFQKKVYLVDYLHGLVDIHNHILPGIDDGAKTVDDSVEMIKGFSEFGVTNFICTPHIMHNYYDNNPKTIQNAFEILSKEMEKQGVSDIRIDYAAEHMIDDNFEAILEKGEVLTHRKHHLLIEMSYLQPSINFDDSIDKIKAQQLFPILAHPERYAFLHKKLAKYGEYKNDGVLFQLNLLSLGGYYGSEVKQIALKLLDGKMINYVGSDIHRIDHLEFLKKITLPTKTLAQLEPIICETIQTFL